MEDEKDIKTDWYVLQVMSGQENKVFEYLDFVCSADPSNVVLPPDGVKKRFHSVFCGLVHGIYELNIPFENVSDVKSGEKKKPGEKKKTKERKLYPGYVLIRMQLKDDNGKWLHENISFVKETKGVITFIGDKTPVSLTPTEADGMMRVRDEAAEGVVKPKVVFNIGEKVIVQKDGFPSIEGVIESIDDERDKLVVLAFMFGRHTPIEADFGQVKRPEE